MDEILVLQAGRVIERGTHARLLAAKGCYAEMLHTEPENVMGTVPSLRLSLEQPLQSQNLHHETQAAGSKRRRNEGEMDLVLALLLVLIAGGFARQRLTGLSSFPPLRAGNASAAGNGSSKFAIIV